MQTFVKDGNSTTTQRMPQGTALGPSRFIFIAFPENVTSLFGQHSMDHHLFVDDKRAYFSNLLEGVEDVRSRLHDLKPTSMTWCVSLRLQLEERARWSLLSSIRALLKKKLAKMEQMVTVGPSIIQPSGSGSRSRHYTQPRTQHNATHHKKDVIMLLSTVLTPSKTLSSRSHDDSPNVISPNAILPNVNSPKSFR